ncbi:PHP-associated domain-containing protein [Chloroflexota bacterium]
MSKKIGEWKRPEGYGIADLHIHSSLVDGMASVYQILEYVERKTDLDVIAITDHDDIRGSYQARELAARKNYRFEVVMGMEVTTLHGHLVAVFIEKPVPTLMSLDKTVEAVHEQGGLCIVPHPMSWMARSIGQTTLDKYSYRTDGVYLDGIEVVNSNIVARISYEKSSRLNHKRYHLSETGASDAHFLVMIGSGYTLFPGNSSADLKQGLLDRTTVAGSNGPISLKKIGYGMILRQLFKGSPLIGIPRWLMKKFGKSKVPVK